MSAIQPYKTPVERLPIYEEVLEIDLSFYTSYICYLLRIEIGDSDYKIKIEELFPEMAKFVKTNISPVDDELIIYKSDLYESDRKQWRIEVLNNCIEDCKEQIKSLEK